MSTKGTDMTSQRDNMDYVRRHSDLKDYRLSTGFRSRKGNDKKLIFRRETLEFYGISRQFFPNTEIIVKRREMGRYFL